jgi:hypothetical protein
LSYIGDARCDVYSLGEAAMQFAEKRTSVPDAVLAAMQRTNELFHREVIVKQNVDALDRIYTVKYVVHWKWEDGDWKWNVDIWNQNE